MTTAFDPTQASAQPATLKLAPDVTPVKPKTIVKEVPNQSWAMVQALNFLQMHKDGLRDPANLASMLSGSLEVAVEAGASNPTALQVLTAESTVRRAQLGLDPIDTSLYKQQRDPRLLTDLIVTLLNTSGLESELSDDLTYQARSLPTVEVTDPDVRPAWQSGVSPEEATASKIATDLGLEIQHSSEELINLAIPSVLSVDSTDPYIKKVTGQ